MATQFLLDENLRGHLWNALCRHNTLSPLPIDAIRVGDSEELPLGITDPDILVWCELNQRILISSDRKSMPLHFADHLASGQKSPGVILLRAGTPITTILQQLVLISHAGLPDDFANQLRYLP